MTITRSDINGLLLPYLKTVFGDYNTWPELYKDVYLTYYSDKAVEYDMEMRTLGLAQLKADGGPIASGSMGQVFQTAYVHQYYGIQFAITRATVKDNQYKSEFPRQAEAMRASLMTVKNINAMNIFNNATGPGSTGSDGLPLLSTQHPIQTGLQANTFNQGVQFSEKALEDAKIIMDGWKNNAGLNIKVQPKSLLISPYNQYNAIRTLESEYRPGTANNDINALKREGVFKKISKNTFLTNSKAWFIITDYHQGFKHYLREALEIDFMTDPSTYNIVCSAIERYSFGYTSWRSCFGSTGL
jgi:hypothetical protein